jgi:hypothetical protein
MMATDPDPIFREEALEYLIRNGGPGDLVRVSTRWTGVAFWLLLVLTAIGVALTLVLQIHGESLLHVLVSHT